MIVSSDPGIPEISESLTRINDNILTKAERAEAYRKKLVTHQAGKGLRLKQFLLAKRKYFRALDIIPRRKRAEDIDLMCRYFNGDQYGSYDDMGIYKDQRQEGDFAYAIPVISGHVEQAFLQILKVKPQYTVSNDDKDDATMKLVAQMCEDIGVKELTRVMEPNLHSEIYNIIISGESQRFVGWEPSKISPKTVKRPKYKSEDVVLPARRECAQCKADVPDDGSRSVVTVCATCGSRDITEIPAGQTKRNTLDGYNEVVLGENTVHIPHMLAMQRDMSAVEPEDSTFLIEYSYLDKHVAEWEYQSEIEPSREGLPVEMLLRFDLERGSNETDAVIGTARLASPGREGGFGAGANSTAASGRKQPQERHFWEASEYGQFVCQVEETLPSGEILPVGTVLGDKWPKGAFVLFLGDTVMEADACLRRRKQTLVRYGRIAGTNAGAGFKKGMPLQDAENDNFNLNQTVKHTVGHPLTVIDGHYVNELPGAGNVLKITRAGLDDVGKVVKQFPGQAVNNSDGAQTIIEGAMQFIFGTNTVGGSSVVGASDMRAAGTATGIAAMQEQAAGRQSGPVDQRIQADKEMILQLLENIQEYSVEEQWAELATRYGPDTAAAFRACNIRQSMTVGIKSNTDMPRSMALTQANYLAFAQAAAQVLVVSEGNPWIMEFLAELATSMGFPFSIGEGRNDRREAEYRLNILTAIEKEFTADPEKAMLLTNSIAFAGAMYEELAERCKPLIATSPAEEDPEAAGSDDGIPRVFLQVHQSFLDVYKDAIFGEAAKGWSEAHKLTVIQLWLDHFKADKSAKAIMAQMQAQAEQAMNPPPAPGPTEPSPEDQAALAEQQAQAEHQRELELKSAEHESDQQSADNELQRELISQSHQAHHQKQLQAAKPQPRSPA